jgi:tetratricopeptide (TPR) repeat protein
LAINRDKVYEGAMKLLAQGKFDKAVVELQKLVGDDPKDVRTLLKIAETLHVKMGKRKEALEAYDRAAAIYSDQGFFLKAVAVFKQMLPVDGNNPDLHLKLAELYQQMGYGSQALHHYQQVVVHYEQGGRSKDTLAVLKRMVDLDPENLQSRVKLAELFFHQGMPTEAVGEMRQSYEYLRGQDRTDDAIRVGEKVCAWDPAATDIARQLGALYMQRGEAKAALTKLQVCYQQSPRDLEILGLIASAFLAIDQVGKTVSVFKEMARIYEGDGNAADARAYWERVLQYAPGDDDAELALGRRQATVMASAAPATPQANPEEEQLKRLLTETDVYVKYGLREKAIEHLDKIFEMRADYLPALEKLRQLQNQTGQKALAIETLGRMAQKGAEHGHPKAAEWASEYQRLQAAAPARPAPKGPPMSSEGEVILVEEDLPAEETSTLVDAKRASGNMLASIPSVMVAPSRRPTTPMADLPPEPSAPPDEPLDEPLDEPFGGPLAGPRDEPLGVPDDEGFAAEHPGDDEPFGEPLAGDGLPPDDDFEAPTQALDLASLASAAAAPVRAPRVPAIPAPAFAQDADDDLAADADALVRSALGMDGMDGMDSPAPFGLAPPQGSEEGYPADELVLDAEDGEGASAGVEFEPAPAIPARVPAPFSPAPVSPTAAPAPAFADDDMGMLDALAAQAVQEAMPERKGDANAAMMGLSDDELGELEQFAMAASGEGAPVEAEAGPSFAPPSDSDFSEATVAYGGSDWQAKLASLKANTAPSAAAATADDSLLETGERPAAPASGDRGFSNDDRTGAIVPPVLGSGEAVPTTGEFDPNAFDLPDDVKAMLAAPIPPAVRAGVQQPASIDNLTDGLDDALGEGFGEGFGAGPGGIGDDDDELAGMIPAATGTFDVGEIPSLASMDAAALEEIAPPPQEAPAADVDDVPDGMSQSRGLFAPERGFEDDPANTFFPDELAEAEFFIQQELLDEAREILEPILEEIDDSERVKHMLARVAAKENGEPEPPAPWQTKLFADVAAEAAPAPELSDPGQVSVEEVLSQFKKGIAETIPEDDAATHYDLGIAYREMGLLDDAVGEFEVAARAASKAADSWFLIGLVRLDQGRAEDALGAFDNAVAAPTATTAQQAAAEYQRGIVFGDHQKRGPDALLALKRSKSLGGGAPDLERRIQALVKAHGDLQPPPTSGRSGSDNRKNVDYV